MLSPARAILWAQLRTLRNFYPRRNMGRLAITVGLSVVWYGLWVFAAVAVAAVLADTVQADRLSLLLSRGLMIALLYWQLIPILMVSAGASLDLKRLLAYPIPPHQLFGLEVLLRLSTGVEMLLVLAGASIGLIVNPAVAAWAPLGFLPFAALNLFLSAGVRNLLGQLFARRYVREISFLLLVTAAALPQLLLLSGAASSVSGLLLSPPSPWWPWGATARAVLGADGGWPWLTLAGWVLVAYAFGRWQFERGLRFDAAEARARPSIPASWATRFEFLVRWPSGVFRDPLGAIVEKELRTLSRAPRFRLVFLMGFTFGLLIWLPIALYGVSPGSFFADHYLTFVAVYALILLGDVSFWNAFGFDRSAARIYFLEPVSIAETIRGKNLAATVFVLLEVTAIALVCFLLQMPLSAARVAECYGVAAVMCLYLLAAGNITSVFFARAADPRNLWRSASAGKFQALLVLVYPVISLPVTLAFLARHLLHSEAAFFGTLAVAAVLGAVCYRASLRFSAAAAGRRQEQLLAALSASEGPVSM